MKKISSFLLALVMSFVLIVPSFATQADISAERFSIIENNVDSFLENIDVHKDVCDYIPLYNFGDELEAYLFYLSDGGYIVASYKDGHIIEFSPDNLPAITSDSITTLYYGGPFTFCVQDGEQFSNIVTGEFIDVSSNYYSVGFTSTIDAFPSINESSRTTRQTPLLTAPSNYVSATTANGWYCTITGISNLLQYYADNYSADMYSGDVSSVSELRTALNSNNYIYNGGLYLSDAATSHTKDGTTYLGLRSYLNRIDVTNYSVTVTSLTGSKVKSQIGTYSRPVLLHIYTSSIDDGAEANSTHIVLCYGYWETSMTTYYIVNNGWGSNGVYVCADDVPTSFEMMYLHQ